MPGHDLAVLANMSDTTASIGAIDLNERTSSVLARIDHPQTDPIEWTIANDFLFIAFDNTIYVYDVDNRRPIAALKDIVPGAKKGWQSAVRRLLVDGDKLLILTGDSKNSRMLDLQELRGFCGKMAESLKVATDILNAYN
jgi:hypothetical protein